MQTYFHSTHTEITNVVDGAGRFEGFFFFADRVTEVTG